MFPLKEAVGMCPAHFPPQIELGITWWLVGGLVVGRRGRSFGGRRKILVCLSWCGRGRVVVVHLQ